MKRRVSTYLVRTPEVSMTWVGGPLVDAEPGFVWLTTPDGRRALKVKSACVKESTVEELAKRVEEDRKTAQALVNN